MAANETQPPAPATLEIRGVEPETRIKLDGVLLANAAGHRSLSKELPAGEHSIQISRNGFLTRTLTRNLAPGQALRLTGRDLQLESSDAQALAAMLKPFSSTTVVVPQPKADDLQWQAVDKNNPDALRAFVTTYPNSAWSNDAKRRMDSVLVARENSDWNSADHGNAAALQDFLRRHPDGRYAASASSALAEIEGRARLAQAQSVEEAAWRKVNARDETSLESYFARLSGKPLPESGAS